MTGREKATSRDDVSNARDDWREERREERRDRETREYWDGVSNDWSMDGSLVGRVTTPSVWD